MIRYNLGAPLCYDTIPLNKSTLIAIPPCPQKFDNGNVHVSHNKSWPTIDYIITVHDIVRFMSLGEQILAGVKSKKKIRGNEVFSLQYVDLIDIAVREFILFAVCRVFHLQCTVFFWLQFADFYSLFCVINL